MPLETQGRTRDGEMYSRLDDVSQFPPSEHERPETASQCFSLPPWDCSSMRTNLARSSVRLWRSLMLLVYGFSQRLIALTYRLSLHVTLIYLFTMWPRLPSSGRCVTLAPGCALAGYVTADEAVIWWGVKLVNRAPDHIDTTLTIIVRLTFLYSQ